MVNQLLMIIQFLIVTQWLPDHAHKTALEIRAPKNPAVTCSRISKAANCPATKIWFSKSRGTRGFHHTEKGKTRGISPNLVVEVGGFNMVQVKNGGFHPTC